MKGFQLPFDYDTLAFIVVSTPVMFDHALKPFILRQECVGEGARDLIDACVTQTFSLVQQVNCAIALIYSELMSRAPISVQKYVFFILFQH